MVQFCNTKINQCTKDAAQDWLLIEFKVVRDMYMKIEQCQLIIRL